MITPHYINFIVLFQLNNELESISSKHSLSCFSKESINLYCLKKWVQPLPVASENQNRVKYSLHLESHMKHFLPAGSWLSLFGLNALPVLSAVDAPGTNYTYGIAKSGHFLCSKGTSDAC